MSSRASRTSAVALGEGESGVAALAELLEYLGRIAPLAVEFSRGRADLPFDELADVLAEFPTFVGE